MIRTAFAGALLCLLSTCGLTPALAASLHPRCGIDWPCDRVLISSYSFEAGKINMTRAERREARRIARGQQLYRAMPFGMPVERPGREPGLVSPLAAKLASIQSACPGTHVISGVRHTYIAGTRRISLHASGKAVDVRGPYGCIYGQLRGWQGGYSTDARRMRHIHISYDADGGREMGLAFRHGGRRYVRHRIGHRYASAGR